MALVEHEILEMMEPVDWNKGIAAISFIGDKVTNSEDVNQLFILPYQSHMAMKVDGEYANEDAAKNAKIYAIDTYFTMNCNSLAYEHLLSILQSAFVFPGDNACEVVGELLSYVPEPAYECLYCHTAIEGSLYKMIRNDQHKKYSIYDLQNYLTPDVNFAFGRIVEQYNAILMSIINTSLTVGKFEAIFDKVFTNSYGEAPNAYAKSDLKVMVGFISAYVRNIMEEELPKLRMAMDLVTTTVACMIKDQPMYQLEDEEVEHKCLEETH